MARADFVQEMYQAALAAGMTDAAARVTASQAAVESGYGKHAPGNNFFGIKAGKSWDGATQRLTTHEVRGGKRVKVKQTFRAYDSPEEGIADRIKFMDRAFPGFSQAQSVGDAYSTLANGRFGSYATAKRSDYEGALDHVNTHYLGGTPVPPGDIPGGSSALDALNTTFGSDQAPDAMAYAGNPLPFSGALTAGSMPGARSAPPPLPRVRPDPNLRTLAPPDLPLNPSIAQGRGSSYGPETGQWGPRIPNLGPPQIPQSPGSIDVPSVADAMSESRGTHAIPRPMAAMFRTASQAQNEPLPPGVRPNIPALPPQFDPGMMGRGLPSPMGAQSAPPMPMARPAALSVQAGPPVPQQRPFLDARAEQITGAPPTADQRSGAYTPRPDANGFAQPAAQQLRLSSGKMIAPGTYTGKNGMTYTVSAGPNGQAVVQSNRAGFINIGREMNAPTLVGGMIRAKIPEALGGIPQNLGYAADNVKNAAVDAASNLGSRIGGLGSGLMSLFGQHPSGLQFDPRMMGRGLPFQTPPIPMRRPMMPDRHSSRYDSEGRPTNAHDLFFSTGFD